MRWINTVAALGLGAIAASHSLAQTVISGTSGPYAAIMEMDSTLPEHTIYRPADLSQVDGGLPIVSFGNGGCATDGSRYQAFLGEVASHGYLVVASGPVGGAPASQASPAASRPIQSTTESLIEAVDWAIAEDRRTDSRIGDASMRKRSL